MSVHLLVGESMDLNLSDVLPWVQVKERSAYICQDCLTALVNSFISALSMKSREKIFVKVYCQLEYICARNLSKKLTQNGNLENVAANLNL